MDKIILLELVIIILLVVLIFIILNKNNNELFTNSKVSVNNIVSHVYVINIDKRNDRMEKIRRKFKNHNITFERVSAVDGNRLKDPVNCEFKEFPNSPQICYKKFWNKYSLGLVRTWKKIINDAIKKKYKNILIFEDDIDLDANFNNKFAFFFSKLPKEWFTVQLSTAVYLEENRLKYINDNIIRTEASLGAFAIMINEKLFPLLLTYLNKEDSPLDVMLMKIAKKTKKSYIFYPGIAYPSEDDFSSISRQKTNYKIYNYKNCPKIKNVIKNKIT